MTNLNDNITPSGKGDNYFLFAVEFECVGKIRETLDFFTYLRITANLSFDCNKRKI